MLWTAAAVAAATAGRVSAPAELSPRHAAAPAGPIPDGDAVFGSISIDTRRLRPGALFVPLRAARDGHAFVAAAVAGGATGYLFETGRLDQLSLDQRSLEPVRLGPEAGRLDPVPLGTEGDGRHVPPAVGIEVADTSLALLDLGRAARARLTGPVVGITGSVGKTSTKDLMAATLGAGRRVAASERSFNNELGVPLTLANAPEDTEIAVIEMGARRAGNIALLCEVARPTIAVVTAVAAVHTELFGSVELVAQAKGELVAAIPASGLAVLNADDHRVVAMAGRTRAGVLLYSAGGAATADVVAADVRVADDLRPSFVLSSPWGSGPVTLGVRGAHQVGNALAAAAVALHQGVAWDAVMAALTRSSISPWRMELGTTPSGATVLNDAYNANPASMAAALRSLARLPARRRVAVVGLMAELGDTAAAEHRAIAALAEALGVELIAVGTEYYGPAPVACIDEALAALGALGIDDAVLVKGSRVAGLERLAAALTSPSR